MYNLKDVNSESGKVSAKYITAKCIACRVEYKANLFVLLNMKFVPPMIVWKINRGKRIMHICAASSHSFPHA